SPPDTDMAYCPRATQSSSWRSSLVMTTPCANSCFMKSLPRLGVVYQKVAAAKPEPATVGSSIASLPFHLGSRTSFQLVNLAASAPLAVLNTRGICTPAAYIRLYLPASSAKSYFPPRHLEGSESSGPTRKGATGSMAPEGTRSARMVVVPWTIASTVY